MNDQERIAYYRRSWEEALRILQGMTLHERERHFDMRTWGFRNDCGTVACLAGHCSLDPWFRQNRALSSQWIDGELVIRGLDHEYRDVAFDRIFGDGWNEVFMATGELHDQAVRMVMLKIEEFGGPSPCPLGFGMPTTIEEPDMVVAEIDWEYRRRVRLPPAPFDEDETEDEEEGD